MDNARDYLSLEYLRRYGAELEVNAFDMRPRPLGWEQDNRKLPEGIYYVANLVKKITDETVLVHKYGNDHYNDSWIVKPDGSCGMEVGTPVLKGWYGLKTACRVVQGFRNDPMINADQRCSCHVHVDVSDMSDTQLASVLSWWVKCEPVFLDAMPRSRKKSQYCQFLGESVIFDDIEDGFYTPEGLFRKLGAVKYYSVNTFHYVKGKRRTIEFRIMDNLCCVNPWTLKNWVRLVIHFVERALARGMPNLYEPGDQWSGYLWLDARDVFDLLGFIPGDYDLSPGLTQVRRWFLGRLNKEGRKTGLCGLMSDEARKYSMAQVDELMTKIDIGNHSDEDTFGDNFRV